MGSKKYEICSQKQQVRLKTLTPVAKPVGDITILSECWYELRAGLVAGSK